MLYLADNLSTLDYKLQEEPMTVIQQLSSVVSTCTQLASILETASVEGHSTNPLDDAAITLDEVSNRRRLGAEHTGRDRSQSENSHPRYHHRRPRYAHQEPSSRPIRSRRRVSAAKVY